MLTRIEINGFKSFQDFALDLHPFHVFIGGNGVGKTNLFEAIHLIAALAHERTAEEAFRKGRGAISELFTLFPDGTRAKRIAFAVEMLTERTINLNGLEAEKARAVLSSRLRYEVTLESRIENGRERVYVVREALLPIKEADDTWAKEILSTKARKAYIVREKRPPYIETVDGEGGKPTIYRNQDAPGGGREGTLVGALERTCLSTANALRYPTIHAAREEMSRWRFLSLNPASLRQPVGKTAPDTLLPNGSNMTAVLKRLSGTTGLLETISKDLAIFIPTVSKILLTPILGEDDAEETLLEIETTDKGRFSSRVLSDGTLRLLTLITLKRDPRHQGVITFEEPENGVQPMRLRQIVDVLFALASDPEREYDADPRPVLRQVIINTHSPNLLAHVPGDSVSFMQMKPTEKGRTTRVIPVRPEMFPDENGRYLTWEQVTQALDESTRKDDPPGL
ncbi:MAG TPA: AAA family ATPase [Aggregatilineales bacterium]|nr:AAA family ATPase [Anaerolineales bacterium]HRE48522.1 AAA family ATPase [Aggregatilineales bacterium]